MILYSEGGTKAQEADAHTVLEILCSGYPGHPWAVRVDQGVVFVRHLEFPGNWGMCKKYQDVIHDAMVFKREILSAAGEFLERAGLVRGRYDDSPILRVEGVPDKYQPPSAKPPLEHTQVVTEVSTEPLRTKPRPQALN